MRWFGTSTWLARGSLVFHATLAPPLHAQSGVTSLATLEAAEEPRPRAGIGWYPDQGFAIRSPDEAFMLHVGLQAGFRIEPYWNNGKSQDRRTLLMFRPVLEGSVFREWFRFRGSFEFAQNPPYLVDAYVELQPRAEFRLRIGQQPTPLSRHEYAGLTHILFADWAPVADYFWTGRDKGLTALGALFAGKLDYHAGVYAGTPLRQFTALNGTWVVVGRVAVNPQGPVATNEVPYITSREPIPTRVSFALQGSSGDYLFAVENFNPSTFRFDTTSAGDRSKRQTGSVDLWLQAPRAAFLVEAYVRRTEEEGARPYRSTGFWSQGSVMLWKRLMDVGVRVNWLDASSELHHDLGYSLEAQFAYYPFQNENVVTKLRYGYGKQDSPGADALGTVTLLLPSGTNHILTLQLVLAI
ncbi:MAG TPA: porin [Polyangiaceae bacterium]|nr:porin [Polyangiaceae bacterium]